MHPRKKIQFVKKYLTLLIIIFISFTSYGEWIKTGENIDGDSDYFDIDRIKKIDEYVYYWILIDYPKPTKWGDLSVVINMKGDCNLNRVKYLTFIYSKGSMNRGKKELSSPDDPEWNFVSSGSAARQQLDLICNSLK